MKPSRDHALFQALELDGGIACFIGAGGKKTTMYRLAGACVGRVAVTTTVRIPPFPKDLLPDPVIATPEQIRTRLAASQADRQAYALVASHPGRHDGLRPSMVASLHTELGFDLTLVKADGARARLIKAPAAHEPALPEAPCLVAYLVSALVIGRPLDERIAHRPEAIARICGMQVGEILRPTHLARLISAPDGGRQGINPALHRLVPIINRADSAERRAAAREAAREALQRSDSFDRVLVLDQGGEEAQVEVINRSAQTTAQRIESVIARRSA